MTSFCWQCGKKLQRDQFGRAISIAVTLPGGIQVRVHKTCEASAIAYQKFDTTPKKGDPYPR